MTPRTIREQCISLQKLQPGAVRAHNQNRITPTGNVKKGAQVACKVACGTCERYLVLPGDTADAHRFGRSVTPPYHFQLPIRHARAGGNSVLLLTTEACSCHLTPDRSSIAATSSRGSLRTDCCQQLRAEIWLCVGVEAVEDDECFDRKVQQLAPQLAARIQDSRKLDEEMRKNLKGSGCDVKE